MSGLEGSGMPIAINCSGCGRSIPITSADAGKRGRCPACGGAIEAPPLDALEPAADAAPTVPPSALSEARAHAPARRSAVSDRLPPEDAGLAAEVERARADPARRLGRFVLLSQLGKGGMGVVWRAWDDRLRRVVALKSILPGEGVDEAAIARFRREAEAAARLRHPAIVAVHEAGEIPLGPPSSPSVHYIAMDCVRGRSLDARLQPGKAKLAAHRAIEMVRDVARAVQYAHEQGVIHRDLKPQNIIVDDESERPFVLDFGLAAIRGARTRLTKTGASMGTPAYMPPEQASGEPVDVRADVYSLGATLYHVLTGRPPFAGESDVNLIVAVLTKDPVPPRRLNPRAAADVETICLRCLEKDKERRYSSAAQLADELDRFLHGDPIEARPIGALERLARSARRNKRNAVLAGLTAALGVASFGFAASAMRADREVRRERDRQEAVAKEHRAAVLETIRRARNEGAGYHDAAVDALAALPELQTVELVGNALDEISSQLETATREVFRSAREPTADESHALLRPIAGIDEALDEQARLSPLLRLKAKLPGPLAEAAGRLEDRAAARRGNPADAIPTVKSQLAAAQERSLGQGGSDLAKACCEALGKIGLVQADAPLARYLSLETSETRAAVAGIALLKLRSKDAENLVLAARDHFGSVGPFWSQVQRFLSQR
ncbi:serine/threonine protein kinase [bacterium]|nr:serine/threonine protein kinase [bacterium]